MILFQNILQRVKNIKTDQFLSIMPSLIWNQNCVQIKKASKVINSWSPVFTGGEYRIRTGGLLPASNRSAIHGEIRGPGGRRGRWGCGRAGRRRFQVATGHGRCSRGHYWGCIEGFQPPGTVHPQSNRSTLLSPQPVMKTGVATNERCAGLARGRQADGDHVMLQK